MSVLNRIPVSMAEVAEYIKKTKNKDAEVLGFIKKFNDIKLKDAEALKEDVGKIDSVKIKEEHVVKIVDTLPETPEDLNKIFVGINLDEDETKKILDAVKQYK